MFRKLRGNITSQHIITGLAGFGTLYFGYHNLKNYLRQRARSEQESQNFRSNKNDLLTQNLRKLYNNFNKKDLCLRNGDLVFIKYNLDKLSFYNKYKMRLIRNLSNNRIYDDIGIVYCSDESYYLILLPSVKIKAKSNVKDLNIGRRGSRGVIAVEYDDLLRENHPDLVSIRRLICSDSTREKVVKSLKSTILDLRSCKNYGFLSTFNSWVLNLPYFGYNCSNFIKALTYRDEIEFAKKSLNKNAQNLITKLHHSLNSEKRDKIDQGLDRMGVEGTKYMIDDLINLEKTVSDYDKDLERYNRVIESFLEKLKGERGGGSKFFGTETSLVTKVYSKSLLLPMKVNNKLFNTVNFFELDSLYWDLGDESPDRYSRLSSPFNVFTGSVNRIRFQNLKYPQIRDVLEFKI